VTEIPEHLLKRSKERRSAIGGGGDAAAEASAPGEAAPAAAVEATAAAPAAAAPAAPEPKPAPKPDRPEVAAAKARRKVPFWAMPVLAALPLWAYVYQATLEPPPAGDDTPLALGQEEYAGCSACHGASGGGVSGPALTGVLETWPDYRDHMLWVRLGSDGWPTDVYGATDKPKKGGMPAHPDLSDEQLAQVVLYERVTFGKLDPASPEAAELTAIAEGTKTLADAGLGPAASKDGADPAALASP
jgi:mono/diheme cytochrome c family protein